VSISPVCLSTLTAISILEHHQAQAAAFPDCFPDRNLGWESVEGGRPYGVLPTLALLGRKWCDVDWLAKTIRIERGVVKQIVDDVKSDTSRKTMSIAGRTDWRCSGCGGRQHNSLASGIGCLLRRGKLDANL